MQAERTALDEVERRLIELTLDKHHGVVAPAARELGVGRTGLASRMQTLGIRRPKPSE
jgi:DNA-binding NtrC family response regulator